MPYSVSSETLTRLQADLETKLERDVVAVIGPIRAGAEHKVRDALEANPSRTQRLAVVLHTGGGLVEVAERMVNVFRHFHSEVAFIIPDLALSAGTVLAMSGDEILMDYFSCLGPIDPQLERDGKLVPALSYLVQFNRLMKKATEGQLTTADFALMGKFDLAELHQFEEARELSTSLLQKWLATYKFKDWKRTETAGREVTDDDRKARALEIARKLSNNEHWHSHNRGIPMETLRGELNLRIQDYGADKKLSRSVRDYFQFAVEYMGLNGISHLVHGKHYL